MSGLVQGMVTGQNLALDIIDGVYLPAVLPILTAKDAASTAPTADEFDALVADVEAVLEVVSTMHTSLVNLLTALGANGFIKGPLAIPDEAPEEA